MNLFLKSCDAEYDDGERRSFSQIGLQFHDLDAV